VIELIFIKRLGLEIHVWRPIDSKFRLVTARRNPNMVILVASLAFSRPDLGLELTCVLEILERDPVALLLLSGVAEPGAAAGPGGSCGAGVTGRQPV